MILISGWIKRFLLATIVLFNFPLVAIGAGGQNTFRHAYPDADDRTALEISNGRKVEFLVGETRILRLVGPDENVIFTYTFPPQTGRNFGHETGVYRIGDQTYITTSFAMSAEWETFDVLFIDGEKIRRVFQTWEDPWQVEFLGDGKIRLIYLDGYSPTMSAIFVLDKGTAKYDYEANRAAFSGELKARGIANLTFSDIAASKNKSVYDFHMLLDVYRSNVSSEIISYFSDQKNADLFESHAVNSLLAEAYVAQGDDLKGEELIAGNLPGAGEKPSNIPVALWESSSRTNHKITLMELGRMQIKYASLEKARRTFSELGDSLMTSEISEVLEATSKK